MVGRGWGVFCKLKIAFYFAKTVFSFLSGCCVSGLHFGISATSRVCSTHLGSRCSETVSGDSIFNFFNIFLALLADSLTAHTQQLHSYWTPHFSFSEPFEKRGWSGSRARNQRSNNVSIVCWLSSLYLYFIRGCPQRWAVLLNFIHVHNAQWAAIVCDAEFSKVLCSLLPIRASIHELFLVIFSEQNTSSSIDTRASDYLNSMNFLDESFKTLFNSLMDDQRERAHIM